MSHAANVAGNITWAATKVPIVPGYGNSEGGYARVDGTLTLSSGVVLKFLNGGYLTVNGTLHTAGSTARPAVFTSIRDDAHGGDTNADGAATSPAPGDWHYVWLGADGSSFDHAAFYYAGGGNDARGHTALTLGSTRATVTNSVFAFTGNADGIDQAAALDAANALVGTVITGNTFYGNKVPLAVNTTFNVDDSNQFDNAAADPAHPVANQHNGIFVRASASVTGNISWAATKVPFVPGYGNTSGGYMDVDGTLTLGNGVVLKFLLNGYLDVNVPGTIVNHDGAGVAFASIRDDSRLGDTNGDGAATTAAKGDWRGLGYWPAPAPAPAFAADDHYADWANVRHATNSSH